MGGDRDTRGAGGAEAGFKARRSIDPERSAEFVTAGLPVSQ